MRAGRPASRRRPGCTAAGASISRISRLLGLDRKTLRRWLRAGAVPLWRKPSARRHARPTPGHLERRWAEGCRNAARLWRELVRLGFPGRPATVRAWATRRRKPSRMRLRIAPSAAGPAVATAVGPPRRPPADGRGHAARSRPGLRRAAAGGGARALGGHRGRQAPRPPAAATERRGLDDVLAAAADTRSPASSPSCARTSPRCRPRSTCPGPPAPSKDSRPHQDDQADDVRPSRFGLLRARVLHAA